MVPLAVWANVSDVAKRARQRTAASFAKKPPGRPSPVAMVFDKLIKLLLESLTEGHAAALRARHACVYSGRFNAKARIVPTSRALDFERFGRLRAIIRDGNSDI